jgi:sugar/nucleoside kinase (ribokinase family)
MRSKDHPLEERSRGLLVVGHVNVDRFLSVTEFPSPDRTAPIVGSRTALGGTAANVARSARSLGIPTGLVGRIGEDFPRAFLDLLTQDSIDLRGLELVASAGTPTCYILENMVHETEVLIDQGPMDAPPPPDPPAGLLDEYAWLHLTTGAPAWQIAWKKLARSAGLRVAVDPGQEIYYRWSPKEMLDLLDSAEILFGNRSEIDRIVTMLGLSGPEELLARVPLIVRTEGPRGATAFARTGRRRVPARPVPRPSTTVGAGDAFRGGFYSGWLSGAPLGNCLAAGNRSAARWVQHGPPKRGRRRRSPP